MPVTAASGPETPASGENAVYAVVASIVTGVCDIDEHELTPERRIRDLGIDSLMAGEVVAQTEISLNIDIDLRKLSDDWATMTLGQLAAELWSSSTSRP
jgi:acyl carrier protein